jgi:competence protein ComFC
MRWHRLLDFFFPPQCAGCNVLGSGFCDGCVPRNGIIRTRFPSLAVTALGPYEGALRAAVLAVKDGRRDVAESLGRIVARLIPPNSAIVAVPTTAKRRRVRGFDGVAVIAQTAAVMRDGEVVAALTQRSGDAQRGKSRRERLLARGRFSCEPSAVLASRSVTLFDDVCTTGATLRDCADAIRAAGGSVENAVVVAVTKSASWSARNAS